MDKRKTFWNDNDGFSISDFISVVITIVFLGVFIYAVVKRDNFYIDMLKMLLTPFLTVIGGYFGKEGILNYIEGKSTKKDNTPKDTQG